MNRRPFFLICLPVFFLLHMVTGFSPVVTGGDLFLPVTAWFIGIPLLVFVLITYIKPSLLKYAFLFLYLEFVYFFFGAVHDFCKQYLPVISQYRYVLPILLAIAVAIGYRAKKLVSPSKKFFLYLNSLFFILIAIEAAQLIAIESTHGRSRYWLSGKPVLTKNAICDSCIKPDIYFILFDGYSGSGALKQYWHFDNSAMDSFFRSSGFFLGDSSTSNYNATSHSVGSMFNLNYHQKKFTRKIDIQQFCEGIQSIENNFLCRYLANNGYTIINESFFPLPGAEPSFKISYLSDKKKIITSQTLAGRLLADVGWNFKIRNLGKESKKEELARVEQTLQQVKNVHKSLLEISATDRSTPAFVYAHFMIPHSPYFFDSVGNEIPELTLLDSVNQKERYLAQLKYTNTVIKNITPHLLKEGNRPRIILIQSDHGYRAFDAGFQSLEFKNLNAIYFPDKQYEGLYNSMSSVNIFRIILRRYFNEPFPLLKDSTVYIRR
jgi:Sulfatase